MFLVWKKDNRTIYQLDGLEGRPHPVHIDAHTEISKGLGQRVQNSHPDAKHPTISIKFYLTFGSSLFTRRECIALIQTGLKSTAYRVFSMMGFSGSRHRLRVSIPALCCWL